MSSYVLELNRWGISNNGTNPLQTTNGINNALVWAHQSGYTNVKLPAGTYLIGKGSKQNDVSVNACILPQSDTVIDLYGCTINKEPNGWEGYRTIDILNKRNVTILGGNIVGDYLTHDYTSPGIHEGAVGILINGSDNVTLKGMDISGFPGYSTCFTGNGGQVAVTGSADWEAGTISQSNGSLVANANFMRMNKFITLASMKYQPGTQFAEERGTDLTGNFYIWGNGYGAYGTRYDGSPANFSTVVFELHFYDNANVYKGRILRRGFDEIKLSSVPVGSTKFKITCRYDLSKLIPSTIFFQILAMNISRGIRVLNCKIHDGFSLAMAVTGAQHILIEQCEMYNIGFSTAKIGKRLYPFPMAIDIEDLTNVNQHITVRSCLFRENEGLHISVVQGRNITFEYNKFDPVGTGSSGVVFQGTRGTNLVSQFNTYTGCTANGEGAGYVLFKRDNFINANMSLNHESIYEGCIFDNTSFQLVMDTTNIFSSSAKYNISDAVLPTTLNGFYYVCVAKTAGNVIQPEPNWSQALKEGMELTANGFTWRTFTYDPTYDLVRFKDCKFSFNKPEIAFGWLNRRGRAEFVGCEFDAICLSGFFSDTSQGWDYIGNNEWSFKDCEFSSTSVWGGVIGKRVSLERSIFKGPSGSVYPIAGFRADDLLVSECTFENFSCIFQGRPNKTVKNLRFTNNISTVNKTVRIFGNNNEGINISNFDNTFIENNKFFMKNANVLNRPLTIFAEKLLKITGNYFESANAANNLELFPAYRVGTHASLPTPKTIEIFDQNHTVQFAAQKDPGYITQVRKSLGDGFTNLNSTAIGSTDRVASVPTSGSYALGQIVYNSAPISGGMLGWVCTMGGVANATTWTTGATTYVLNTVVNIGGNVYTCAVKGAGASTDQPVGIAGTAQSYADGYSWLYLGTLAVFKTFGVIS
jgi:hypothetical protein